MRFSLLLAAFTNSKLRSMLLAGMFILFAPALHADTIYVDRDASGSGSGADWTNAYTLLQEGLAAASSGDEVWVADGAYYPDELLHLDREATFQLKNGVAILGGFDGTEFSREQRRPHKHSVRLSGDLDQNDDVPSGDGCSAVVDVGGIKGNNSYHVVTANGTDATAILDGFKICNGLADGTGAHAHGAGIQSELGSPTLSNLLIQANFAQAMGGGMYSTGNPTITDVRFQGNVTHTERFAILDGHHHEGGGLWSEGDPRLTRVHFRFGFSNKGGGMASLGGEPVLNHVTFESNTALDYGGGLYLHGFGILNNVLFENNEVQYDGYEIELALWQGGGGMAIIGGSTRLTNVTFSGNKSHRPLFQDNHCQNGLGGGLLIHNTGAADQELNNVVFQGNHSHAGGGGLAIAGDGHVIGTNVTFAGNEATAPNNSPCQDGDGIFSAQAGITDSGATSSFRNTIIWGHIPGKGVRVLFNERLTFSDSLLQDCGDSWSASHICGTDGGGNHALSDPQFVEPVVLQDVPTVKGNLRLKLGSPALDVGNNSVIQSRVTTDRDGRQRIRNTTVDLGAYELPVRCDATATKLYVDRDATGDNTGLDWDNALHTLQDALFMRDRDFCGAARASEIWVAEGIYYTNEGPYTNPGPYGYFIPRDEHFDYPSSILRIYGGFQGNETSLDQRDWVAHPTVLSADVERNDIQTNGVLASGDDIVGKNSFHVFHSERSVGTELDGFTLTGGSADLPSADPFAFSTKGGGFVGFTVSTHLRHLVFSGNRATYGGGMYLEVSSSTLEDITFFGNTVWTYSGSGAGLYLSQSPGATLVDMKFVNNHSDGGGGGMVIDRGSPSISNSIFSGNSAQRGGGGLYNSSSFATLVNVSFFGNKAESKADVHYGSEGGGAILNSFGFPIFTNVLISGNSSVAGGGGMYNDNSTVLLTNVTVSGNRSSGHGGGIYNMGFNQFGDTFMHLTLQNSVIWNNQDASGTANASSSIWNVDGSPAISFSDVQHCGGGNVAWDTNCGTDGGNNLQLDPLFEAPSDPAVAPSASGNLRLQATSPLIDTGHSNFNSTGVDLDGKNRVNDGIGDGAKVIDMGPYEAPTVKYGEIYVRKVTQPAGISESFDFELSGGAVVQNFSLSDGNLHESGPLQPGTYSVSEIWPGVEWVGSVQCTDGSDPNTIDLAADELVLCTFTNTKPNSIVVQQSTTPGGGTGFGYTHDIGAGGTFSLDDGQSRLFESVGLGLYTFTQGDPSIAGYDLVKIDCQGTGAMYIDDVNRAVSITMGSDDTAHCIFENERRGRIRVVKETHPSGDPQSFDFSLTGGPDSINQTFALIDQADHDSGFIRAGTYNVAETIPTGWELSEAKCSDGSPPDSIVLDPGETVTCTFTNIEPNSIVVQQGTAPSGGTGFGYTHDIGGVGAFSLDGGKSLHFDAVSPGVYTITQDAPSPTATKQYDLRNIFCSGTFSGKTVDLVQRSVALTLEGNQTAICTFVNVQRGQIRVDKLTYPADDPQIFNFALTGGPDSINQTFALTDNATVHDSGLIPAGTYNVAETIPAGWELSEAKCSNGSSSRSIDLSPGEIVTCTFSNTEQDAIVVLQRTTPGGGTGFGYTHDIGGAGGTFSLDDGGEPKIFDAVSPATYTITQDDHSAAGYELKDIGCIGTFSGKTVDLVNRKVTLTLEPGQSAYCDFENELNGRILVDKVTYPSGEPQSFDFALSGGPHNISQTFALTDQDAVHDSGFISAGIYKLSELALPEGWELSTATCDDGSDPGSIALKAGKTVTCTFSNTKEDSIVVIQKTTPGGGKGFGYTHDITGGGGRTFTLDDGEPQVFADVSPNTYEITQDDPSAAGYKLVGITCNGTVSEMIVYLNLRRVILRLEPKQTAFCTFENVLDGRILVSKVTDPEGDPQSFDFALTGGPDSINQTFALTHASVPHDSGQIPVGSYNLTETLPSGWDQSEATCSDGSLPGSIVLDPGETVICNFKNALHDPRMTVTKSAAPADFALLGDYITYRFAVKNTGNVVLNYVTVTDPLKGLGAVDCNATGSPTVPSLAVATTVGCQARYSITQDDLDTGFVTNRATVKAKDPSGKEVTAHSNEVTISWSSNNCYDHLTIPDGMIFSGEDPSKPETHTYLSEEGIDTEKPATGGVWVEAPHTLILKAPDYVEFSPLFKVEGDADVDNPPGGGQLRVIIGTVSCD